MAAFASDRRAGWVRFFVVLLCALFVFATLGAPVARADALTVGLFTAAAVLSAVTAALGFKLSNSEQGQATLAKMVQDFKVSATAVGLVLVGSKINGLIDGVDYIKMQVKAGKTYLDERVVAWVQQWLGLSGVYDGYNSTIINLKPDMLWNYKGDYFHNYGGGYYSIGSEDKPLVFPPHSLSDFLASVYPGVDFKVPNYIPDGLVVKQLDSYRSGYYIYVVPSCTIYFAYGSSRSWYIRPYGDYYYVHIKSDGTISTWSHSSTAGMWGNTFIGDVTNSTVGSFGLQGEKNNTGLIGSDTIGKDVVDKSLDEVLAGLKEWAPDWWDAGADSSTNGAAAGTKDLPLNMGSDVKTVTGNPALEVDQPLIYTPWFEQDVGQLRNGETAGTVTNTATNAAETADKAEAAEGTVEDAQDVVQSIINWGLDYISPDKGLFSRFPLCIPYDAYLLVTAALGVDAQDLGDIVGQSPGDLSAQVDDGVAVQSDFVPVISVKHDWTQDGVTTPLEVTIDLRPYDAVIKMIRTLVSVYVIAELIASEYKRIRGS